MAAALAALDSGEEQLEALDRAAAEAKARYDKAAAALSARRQKAARPLEKSVTAELPALKLERAEFKVAVESDPAQAAEKRHRHRRLHRPHQSRHRAGPLMKVASGGELARFLLALKVALADRGSAPTLVFDEIDTAVGGAVADAIGARLARLADRVQVLVRHPCAAGGGAGRRPPPRRQGPEGPRDRHRRHPPRSPAPARGDRPHACRRHGDRRGPRRGRPPHPRRGVEQGAVTRTDARRPGPGRPCAVNPPAPALNTMQLPLDIVSQAELRLSPLAESARTRPLVTFPLAEGRRHPERGAGRCGAGSGARARRTIILAVGQRPGREVAAARPGCRPAIPRALRLAVRVAHLKGLGQFRPGTSGNRIGPGGRRGGRCSRGAPVRPACRRAERMATIAGRARWTGPLRSILGGGPTGCNRRARHPSAFSPGTKELIA